MKELLGIAIKNNPFLFEKYPEIYNFVYSGPENSIFKSKTDALSQSSFAQEFIKLTKASFELTTDNALSVMEEETLLLKGPVDYKASFLSLLEYQDFEQIGFIKIGNIIFMKVSYLKKKIGIN